MKSIVYKLSLILILIVNIAGLSAQTNYLVSGQAFDQYTETPLDSFFVTLRAVQDSSLVDSGFFTTNDWSLNFTTVGINDDGNPYIPSQFILGQNYPNPFNPVTRIPFSISEAGNYKLESFNLLGQTVSSLSMYVEPGIYEVAYGFGCSDAGLQILRLSGNGYSKTIKILSLDGGDGR